jgi:hypothetical protein
MGTLQPSIFIMIPPPWRAGRGAAKRCRGKMIMSYLGKVEMSC